MSDPWEPVVAAKKRSEHCNSAQADQLSHSQVCLQGRARSTGGDNIEGHGHNAKGLLVSVTNQYGLHL